MALYLAGSQVLRLPRLYPEARFQVSDRFGMFTAPIAGAAFAFGWSPCLGPVIAAVFGVAATQTGLPRGHACSSPTRWAWACRSCSSASRSGAGRRRSRS